MNITEVHVVLAAPPAGSPGRSGRNLPSPGRPIRPPSRRSTVIAYASITLDGDLVVREMKVIDGPRGPFVAMPTRKVTTRCPDCRHKCAVTARYCEECGVAPANWPACDQPGYGPADGPDDRDGPTPSARRRIWADVCFPCTSAARAEIERAVLAELEEVRRAAEDEAALMLGGMVRCGPGVTGLGGHSASSGRVYRPAP